jgi:hypothetical protein
MECGLLAELLRDCREGQAMGHVWERKQKEIRTNLTSFRFFNIWRG